ncbi:MAG TPA: tRNA (adenosine(37)-N6)-dimethylallyltransferase MiaA [Rhizomicrobium sp.]|jgi:tRNA dimethylallyltransferase|nr:tRNA (adenosine(37)-N6)-dimethylallyltransferase MiaA [Rhizomicrobium sp.]
MTGDAVLIAGPTASGKSRAALELAEIIGGVVINADSMQVYAEAPILTAQPPAEDRARVPHLLYGHVPAREVYSVGRWRDDAIAALEQARAMARTPIFVGGTGMYFGALTDGLADIPPVPPDVRDAARALLDEIGVAALHARLAARDPVTASRLRPTDPQRVLRAWEVLAATGRPLSAWQDAPAAPVLRGVRIAAFVLDPPRAMLRAQIAARFAAMVDQGGLDEARALVGLDPALPAAKLLGLRPLQGLAAGNLTREAALEAAITATRQFAKRQMTWFRHRMAHYIWYDPSHGNIITRYKNISA